MLLMLLFPSIFARFAAAIRVLVAIMPVVAAVVVVVDN